MLSLEQFLLHKIAFPGPQTTAQRIAEIEALQVELLPANTLPAPDPAAAAQAQADLDAVEAVLADLKANNAAEFHRFRRLPFADQLAAARG